MLFTSRIYDLFFVDTRILMFLVLMRKDHKRPLIMDMIIWWKRTCPHADVPMSLIKNPFHCV